MEYRKEVKKPGRQTTMSSPADVRRRQSNSNNALVLELRDQLNDLKKHFKSEAGGLSPEKIDAEIRKEVKKAIDDTKKYYKHLLKDAENSKKSLKEKIEKLESKLKDVSVKEKEVFDVNLSNTKKELEEKYNNKISSLEDRLKLTEDKLEEKENKLESLAEEKDNIIKKMFEDYTKKLEVLTEAVSLEKTGVDDPNRPGMEDVFIDPLEKDSGDGFESHISYKDTKTGKKEKIDKKVNKLKDLMGGGLPK